MRIVPTIKITDDVNKLRIALNRFSKYNIDTIRFIVTKHSLEEHIEFIKLAQSIYVEINDKEFKLLLDIPCPKDKLRFDFMNNEDSVSFQEGEIINIINSRDVQEHEGKKYFFVAADFKNRVPETAIIGDGELLLKLTTISEKIITAVCMNSATIKKGKAIASPTGFLKITDVSITEKVLKIISVLHPEICVLSYIENAEDINNFKMTIYEYAGYIPHIMSKIECQKAVDNAESIVDNSDSIMIARGCLAVNVGIENMIESQDTAILESRKKYKEVCIASNILRSLNSQNWPSRADIADLSYMIIKGVNYFVITDGYCMEDKFNSLMYFLNNTYLIYSKRR